MMYEDCSSDIAERRLVVFADTSDLIFHNKKNRIKDEKGLCRLSNYQHRGYKGLILHTNLVCDRDTGEILGNSHVGFIERKPQSRADKNEVQRRMIENIETKESYKWENGFEKSRQLLNKASHLTLVADREGDIIELFDRLPDEGTDLIVRSCHNRNVKDRDGKKTKLVDMLSKSRVEGHMKIEVSGKKRKRRVANMTIKYKPVLLNWPNGKRVSKKNHKTGVPVYVVEIKEKKHRGYKTEPLLIWRILTSMPIETVAAAKGVISIYKQRWKIEEFFKLLKTDCYDIEKTELTKGRSIRKLILYVMKASIKIQRLKSARYGSKGILLTTVFNKEEIRFLKILNTNLEGTTAKQKNPYPVNDLSFGAWIIARLGGWKEYYDKSRPPGTKTFAAGLEKFENIAMGFRMALVS